MFRMHRNLGIQKFQKNLLLLRQASSIRRRRLDVQDMSDCRLSTHIRQEVQPMNRSRTNFSGLGGGSLPHIHYTRGLLLLAQTKAGAGTLDHKHRKYNRVHWTHLRDGLGVTWWLRELSAFEGRRTIRNVEADPQVCKCMHWHTNTVAIDCLLYTSPSPRDRQKSRMPSSA